MLDTINWKIIKVLQRNARISFAELGKEVHLSAPAVAERIKKLEESGVIEGYKPQLNLDKLGYPIVAQVQARVFLGKEPEFINFVKSINRVVECNNVTGEKAFLLKVVASHMKELDQLLESFSTLCETNSMIVLSQVVTQETIEQP